MGITTSGIGSGIDIQNLVQDLISAEGDAKKVKFDTDEALALSKITAYDTINSALNDFRAKLSNLKNLSTFQKRNATSEDSTVFTATTQEGAASGNYSVEVTQLAVNHKIKSQIFNNKDEIVGTGTLKFTRGSTEFSIDISSGANTLDKIKDKINDYSSTTGIEATIISGDAGAQLVFTAKNSGVDNIFTVSVTSDGDGNDGDDAGLSQLDSTYSTIVDTGLDSIVNIDGATITSTTNIVENAVSGLTLNLLKTNIGDAKTLDIIIDKTSAKNAVSDFVAGYNTVIDSINELTEYKDNDSSGVLLGDATVRGLEIQLRRELNSAITVSGIGYKVVSEVGVTSNALTGKLELNDSKLTSALDSNFDAVGNLFAQDDDGIALRLDSLLQSYTQIQGVLDNKKQGLSDSIITITEQRINLERRLISMEQRLLSSFINMDKIVAQLQNTSEFLTQQLSSLVDPLAFKKK